MAIGGLPRRGWLLVLAFLAAAVCVAACIWARRTRPTSVAEPTPLPIPSAPIPASGLSPSERHGRRIGGLDLTFLVFADTHLGFESVERDPSGALHDPVANPRGVETVNREAIADMNGIAGKPWPSALGGTIGAPRGLLVAGDLTEDGDPWQWNHFVAYYGHRGGDGLLRYPVFEGHGNHDKHHSWYVLDRVRERHGGMVYSFDWDDLHLVCLGEAPDDAAIEWLGRDLAAVGPQRPVLVYFHFPLLGPWSDNNWFGEGNHRDKLAKALRGVNVIAIFHGHYHASGRYRWNDIDVYNVGAAKHSRHSFAVVHVDDRRLRVASWHFGQDRWEWWHQKPIHGTPGEPIEGGEHAYGGQPR